ncbi:Phenol 2-monooxygenase [Candida viswanathii]|uniref:Phenol 2-monooxygenase n=1 Tax=Candida viswanathii TaxID=5486 RepID=A0A367YKC7_9ASCO|nr:Phenol 2-monooxygenase [Candida viswanathii]
MAIKESQTDVLIIGAGPSGFMCATWLARCGIPFRIIDKRSTEVFAGQADGLQCRSLEIFKSFSEKCFDFATLDQGWKVANHMIEMCFWSPDENGQLVRNSRVADTIPGISRFTQSVIHQGNIEKWFEESIDNFSGGKVKVERPLLPVSLQINEDAEPNTHAVDVLVKKLCNDAARPEQYGKVANGLFRAFDGDQEQFYKDITKDNEDDYELIHAKYVVGSDGAHSWVRKQLGIDMEGEQTDFVWGVLDMVPITNFPDIRSRCAIHSKDSGSVMVIPRENDLVRFYIQLKEVERDPNTLTKEFSGTVEERRSSKGRIDRSKITPESILKQAQEIFKPYSLEMTDLSWYTGYQIGQRVSPKFASSNRVFISGDACHTHSPKAGQGMNVSMQDTYNLGFKLALVCKGLAKQDILSTYESERLKVARDLIAFDHKLSRLFSGKPMIPNSDVMDGVNLDEFHSVYLEGNKFASGTIVDYEDSLLVSKKGASKPDEEGRAYCALASKVPIGRRLYSSSMIAQSDGLPVHIADRAASDGRFRVLIFAGDVKKNPGNIQVLYDFQELIDSNDFFAKKYTPVNAFSNSVFDIITIHASNRHDVEIEDFPAFTHELDYKRRCDYWSLYSGVGETYHEGDVDIYSTYGIDKKKGAIVVLRPDSHVALVSEFSVAGLNEVNDYFDKFMIPQTKNVLPPKDPQADDTKRFVLPKLAV